MKEMVGKPKVDDLAAVTVYLLENALCFFPTLNFDVFLNIGISRNNNYLEIPLIRDLISIR